MNSFSFANLRPIMKNVRDSQGETCSLFRGMLDMTADTKEQQVLKSGTRAVRFATAAAELSKKFPFAVPKIEMQVCPKVSKLDHSSTLSSEFPLTLPTLETHKSSNPKSEVNIPISNALSLTSHEQNDADALYCPIQCKNETMSARKTSRKSSLAGPTQREINDAMQSVEVEGLEEEPRRWSPRPSSSPSTEFFASTQKRKRPFFLSKRPIMEKITRTIGVFVFSPLLFKGYS